MKIRFLFSRSLSYLLLASAALALVACGGNAATAPTATPAASQAAATDTPLAVVDTPVPAATPAPAQVDAGPTVPAPAKLAEGSASGKQPSERDGMYTAPPTMTIDTAKFYYATLKTARGDIKVQLFAERVPKTVNNFVFLARDGFYNNTTFHRVLDGFMAQAGDPAGTGGGGPGYEFEDEFFPGLGFDRPNLLAMANRGPTTNGSQFFITLAPTEWLNGLHTIFGEVIAGQDILAKLTRRDPNENPTTPGDTLYTVEIEESDTSLLPTPTPAPPTATPTNTPTPFAPAPPASGVRPLATISTTLRANYYNSAPAVTIDQSKQYTATIATSKGDLTVELYDDQAPVAVNNFVLLANLGFYDGSPINNIAPNQAIIIGSPDNNPQSDAGYRIDAEINLSSTLGIGSLAYIPFEEGPPIKASSSQLLIALIVPPDDVRANFSFFGRVVQGIELVATLAPTDTIKSITITSK